MAGAAAAGAATATAGAASAAGAAAAGAVTTAVASMRSDVVIADAAEPLGVSLLSNRPIFGGDPSIFAPHTTQFVLLSYI